MNKNFQNGYSLNSYPEAEALMDVIAEMNIPMEVINVQPGQKVILPRSKMEMTQVWYAGGTPDFLYKKDRFGNMEAYIPEDTVIQVIFSNTVSMHDEQMKVFTTL